MATIHGVILSPFVRKVRVIMEEKGLDYEVNPVLPFQLGDDFLKLHPLKKIPVYEEAGYILPDSSCIALYLERKQPEPSLYPRDDRDYGTALFFGRVRGHAPGCGFGDALHSAGREPANDEARVEGRLGAGSADRAHSAGLRLA